MKTIKRKYPRLGLKHLDWANYALETNLSSTQKLLVLTLSMYMNRNKDIAYPSLNELAARASLNKATVCRNLEVLEKEGWLIRVKGNSITHKATEYSPAFPKFVEDLINSLPDPSRIEQLPQSHQTTSLVAQSDKASRTERLQSSIRIGNLINTNALFEEFYKVYPKHRAKPQAMKAWIKNGCEELARQIIDDVKSKSEGEWKALDSKFIPYPATYLNNRRWEDEGDKPEDSRMKELI